VKFLCTSRPSSPFPDTSERCPQGADLRKYESRRADSNREPPDLKSGDGGDPHQSPLDPTGPLHGVRAVSQRTRADLSINQSVTGIGS